MFIRTILICIIVAFPLKVHAYTYPYYAQKASRSGSEIERFTLAATFLYERAYSGSSSNTEYLCSVSRLLPYNRGAGFLSLAADRIAAIASLTKQDVLVKLASNPCPIDVVLKKPLQRTLKTLRLDKKGSVVSTNPVWNACIRGLPLSAEFMWSNPDTYVHRQGAHRVARPLSCREYHRGPLNIWKFADDFDIELVLDRQGRLLGDPPIGYSIVTP